MKSEPDLFVVGVGSSAGGLKALRDLVKNLPLDNSPFTLIIAQHVSPEHKSQLVNLLSESSAWPVYQAENKQSLEAKTVYVVPPDSEVNIVEKSILLSKYQPSVHPVPSVNNFFKSIAKDAGKYGIGVILSGTGKDGVEGVSAIKEQDGMVIAQVGHEATYASMPDEARKTGFVDLSSSTAQMGEQIRSYIRTFNTVTKNSSKNTSGKDNIFSLLTERSGTDFSKYKPSTIDRRINKRVTELALTDVEEYDLYIRNNPAELDKLFATVLIGITEFFRDKKAFEQLEDKISRYLKSTDNKSIRIWSVGCATGEEPYSIAIILSELLGEKLKDYRIQIFATDIDYQAINLARKGFFTRDQTSSLSNKYLKKYFTPTADGYEISKIVRQLILFARHDISTDPPFVRMNFIVCRNLLIYFNAELQKNVLPVFHYALNDGGYLLLGKSENTSHLSELFKKHEGGEKLFLKRDNIAVNTLNYSAFNKKNKRNKKAADASKGAHAMSLEEKAQKTLIETYQHPYVVLDADMSCLLIKGSLKPYIDLSEGRLNSNIIKILDRRLHSEVRTLFYKVKREKEASQGNIITLNKTTGSIHLQLVCKPFINNNQQDEHYLLEFQEYNKAAGPTPPKELINNPNFDFAQRIMELEQELELNYQHLNTFTEELETNNEEIQTMNEELQSSNEELRSSNEELETGNEELQSINEELQTANAELNVANENLVQKEHEILAKKAELEQLNQRFSTVLENSKVFIAYQDQDLKYVWYNNPAARYEDETLIGISDYELFNNNKSAEKFISLKKKVLKTHETVSESFFFQGKYWKMKVKPWFDKAEIKGIIVLSIDVTDERKAYKNLELKGGIINALTANTKDYLLVVDQYNEIQLISKPLQSDIERAYSVKLEKGDSIANELEEIAHLRRKIYLPIQKSLEGKASKKEELRTLSNSSADKQVVYAVQVSPIIGNKEDIIGAEFRGAEITDLIRSKTRVQDALKRGSHLIAEEYFRDLTLELYELFNSKSAYVGVLSEDKNEVITKAIRIDGKLASNFSYKLSEVPCEMVQRNDEMKHYERVISAFPNDPKLHKWNAVDYIGVPISSPITGEMLGIMVIINDSQIALNADLQYLLTILSLRAGAELLREQSTKALEVKEKQFENISNNSPGVIYEFRQGNDGEQQFTYVSASSNEVLELAPQQIVKRTELVYDILHPEEKESFFQLQKNNLKNPQPTEWIGRIKTAKTNEIKWIKISSQPDQQNEDEIIWYGIISDITAQKETEIALKKAKEEAEKAANAKEDFLATMSHEIRTPLNAIYGISELLKLDKQTQHMDEVELLRYSSENLLSLINNILDFSKLKAGKLSTTKKPFNLKTLLENISKSSRFLAGRQNNKFILQLDPKIPSTAIGDELILTQILHNLLSNANKFTNRGTVKLSVNLIKDKNASFIIKVIVADTGEGIDENHLKSIFNKFEQSNHNIVSKGTGLGLTITKALLKLLNTDIEVDSKKGQGSSFYFTLELEKDLNGLELLKPEELLSEKTSKQPIKILMVEDNRDNRMLVDKFFQKKNFAELDFANNGKDAVEMVKNSDYDMILMDLRMPVMNGIDATLAIRNFEEAKYRELPIIALTADTHAALEDINFTDIISKPFEFKNLMRTIAKHLG